MAKVLRGAGLCAVAALAACGASDDDDDDGVCDPMTEVCVYERDVSTITIGAGVEDEDTCQSWTLNNPTELWVNGISQENDGAYHHANWFFVPDDRYPLPDGTWSCSEQDFDELNAALLGGYLFALSTQSAQEAQTLPTGSAIRVPPYSRVVGSSHLLNASADPVETTMHLRIHTIPPAQVEAKMAPGRIQYHDLRLDPMARSSFSAECLFADDHQAAIGAPLQYELHYVLSHYHGLGKYAELQVAGGPNDGEVIMRHNGYGENFGVALDPPFDLAAKGALGLRFICGYENPRDVSVGWGIGDQEMCVVALQARSQFAFDGDVRRNAGAPLPAGPDGEVRYGADCNPLLGFQWDFEKAGGPPR